MDQFYGHGRNHLFVPGPTNIPEEVIRAMNRNNENHRSPVISELTKTLLNDIKKIFKTTSGIPFLIPTTGTGAWESALTNTCSPGDRVVSFLIGQFSHLWIEQKKQLKFNVDVVESEWGQGADLDILASKIASDRTHTIKAICIVHNETTTGVTNDLTKVRKILDEFNHPALIIVDAVSSIGALDFRMDEWGVDVVVTSSQKALSLPTGMGIVCAGPKAIEASKSAKSARSFFDWNGYLKCYKLETYWPYTPSIHLLYGLRAALDLIFEEGYENVILRHNRFAKATRLAVEAWGLKNCCQKEEMYSASVTAVVVPPNIDSGEIVKRAWKKYNLSLGGGLSKVAGKVFRIGHIGHLNEEMDPFYGHGRNHLFVPGPTNIPEQVICAMNRNNEDTRSPVIPALTKTLLDDIKKIFKTTSGIPFLIPTTGTGASESALTNTCSPGDRVVSFLIGQFSHLWIEQIKQLKFNVDVVESEWGQGADLYILASKIASDKTHTIKAICIVHNETTTGVTNDLTKVRKILDELNHPALIIVDAVSSIGALDFRMDEWGVDVVVTGSQKALSLPTGMGIICAGPKAIEASKSAKSARSFFDWNGYLKCYKLETYWPYTPPIQLLYGLRAVLDLIFKEGYENVILRHNRFAKATR